MATQITVLYHFKFTEYIMFTKIFAIVIKLIFFNTFWPWVSILYNFAIFNLEKFQSHIWIPTPPDHTLLNFLSFNQCFGALDQLKN